MKPTKMGGDELGDEEVEVEVAADADASVELLGEGDVEDMVTAGLVSEMALTTPWLGTKSE